MERWQNRRSKRIPLQVRVRIYSHRREKGSFREEAQTLNVSASGTLLALAMPVELGQTVVLTNRMTGQDQECRVAFVGAIVEGKARVGLAFKNPAPHFWQLDFPPLQPAVSRAPLGRAAARAGQRR